MPVRQKINRLLERNNMEWYDSGNDFEGALLRPEIEIDEEIKFEELIESVKDVIVTKEIKKMWMEQNELLQQG